VVAPLDSSGLVHKPDARDWCATLAIARAGREPVEPRTQVSDGPAAFALLVATSVCAARHDVDSNGLESIFPAGRAIRGWP